MEEQKKKKYKKITKITGILVGLILVLGTSYAIFRSTSWAKKTNQITTGKFNVIITDESDEAIVLENAFPITDEEGLSQKAYTFKVKNTGTITARYTLTLEVPSTTTLPNTVVKYNLVEDGENITIDPITLTNATQEEDKTLYKIDTDVILPDMSKSYSLQLWVDYNATKDQASNKNFEAKVRVDAEQFTSGNPYKEGTVAYQLLEKSTSLKTANTKYFMGFNPETEEAGLYEYEDLNGGKTYYFRGNVENNYVSFAGQIWRIVRVMEDGSARLILDDRINNSYYRYNTNYDDARYVNYNGSDIEQTVNSWYQMNISNYDKYVKTSTYCNDKRENNENAYVKFMFEQDSSLQHVYGIYSRIDLGSYDLTQADGDDTNGEYSEEEEMAALKTITLDPKLSCEESDKLQRKVALLSIDEAVLAGIGMTEGNSYLVKNYSWWTMSPALVSGYADVSTVYSFGDINNDIVDGNSGARPVISLNANIAIRSGSGTSSDPYVVG